MTDVLVYVKAYLKIAKQAYGQEFDESEVQASQAQAEQIFREIDLEDLEKEKRAKHGRNLIFLLAPLAGTDIQEQEKRPHLSAAALHKQQPSSGESGPDIEMIPMTRKDSGKQADRQKNEGDHHESDPSDNKFTSKS